MLNTMKLRSLYSKIQTQLFYMIPEKWDRIYLYASIVEKANKIESGEMFFYYYPKGLLKRNPINVYEVPSKFNVDENRYMKLVDDLYETIKMLREEFKRAKEKLWTNLTISIVDLKFHVDYHYENLNISTYSNYDRHIVWKYKYLNFPKEKFSKKEQEMLEYYLIDEELQNIEIQNYTEGMYRQKVHNIIEYDREETTPSGKEEQKREEIKIKKKEEKKLDKYELYKKKQAEKKQKDTGLMIEEQKENKKNQILNC